MKSSLAAAASLVLASSTSGNAAILMECGASKGVAFALEGGILPHDQASQGFEPDGISKGSISLIRDGEDFDIIVSDSTGSTFSARADGANVVALLNGPDQWLVIAIYPLQTIETYQFDRNSHGGEVLWTQHKFGEAPIRKVAAFRAPCGRKP